MTDQQRFDTLGCAGSPIAHTPNLDHLAASGVRFDNCYATQAVCSPSRASILSGLFPTSHRVMDNIYNVPDTTASPDYNMGVLWPGLLRQAGYRTAWIGKWHLGDQAPECFDDYLGFNSLLPHWLGEPHKSQYRVEMEADQAIDFLREHGSRPFALCLSHYPPHTPFTAPYEFMAVHANLPLLMQKYYGAVAAIDYHIGRVLAAVDELGLRENTVVVFTSDHGETFGQRAGGSHKRSPYDECARVPLIVSAPGTTKRGLVREELVSLVDLMPTFLELAGLEVPDGLHGTSLLPLLKGNTPEWRNAVFVQNMESCEGKEPGTVASRAIRTKDFMLLMRDGLSDHARNLRELYDLRSDPYQFDSIYGEGHTETVRGLLAEMEEWARGIGDEKALELIGECREDLEV